MKNFITPSDHVHFLAKKLFNHAGEIINGSITYLETNDGSPLKIHTHKYLHLFIATQGEVKIILGEKEMVLKEGESYPVSGNIPHNIPKTVAMTVEYLQKIQIH